MIKVAFLDRDGTINVDYGYVGMPDRFEFIDGVFTGCRLLRDLDYKLIVVTNQSGIARGYYSERDFLKSYLLHSKDGTQTEFDVADRLDNLAQLEDFLYNSPSLHSLTAN